MIGKTLIGLLCCATLGAGVLLVAHGSGQTAAALDPPPPATGADFAVLAQKPTPADRLPDAVKQGVLGNNPASVATDSRSISTPTGRGWVITVADKLCVVVPDPVDGYAVGCTPAAIARTRGAMAMLGKDGHVDVTLVLPYGAKAARNVHAVDSPLDTSLAGVVTTALNAGESITVTDSKGTSTKLPAPVAAAPASPPTDPASGPTVG
jgi:hypothetical protein